MDSVSYGVDVGGSSIKHAPIDANSGRLLEPLDSTPTPMPANADNIVRAIARLTALAPAQAPFGVALPSVIRGGIVCTAANLDRSLIGNNVTAQLVAATGRHVVCLNDADAAGLAELRWGAARGTDGTVMMLTFGTGIGSALFTNGQLVPNTELGHLQMNGREAEHRASARARSAEALDWPEWAQRVNEYLALIDALFWPELVVIGGGVVENYAQFGPLLQSRAELRAASLGAAAGVAGAALAAWESRP